MARTVDVIKAEIKVKIRTYPSLDNFKFPEEGGSAVGVFNLMIDTISVAIFTFEVIMDQLKADIQAVADKAISGNDAWLRDQMKKFQYGDTIQLVDFVPTYVPIDVSKRIITQCAVKDIGSGIVAIKLAKGASAPFSPLTTPELNAVKDYYYGTSVSQGILFSGTKAAFVTLDPDRMYVEANVYYFGQYVGSTVKTAVISAIDAFLSSFSDESFDGRVFVNRLVNAIESVPGVSRTELVAIKGRAAATAFGSATVVPLQGYYDTAAGHLISEDTASQTLTDKITMLLES